MERRHMRFLSLLISLFVMVSLCATTVFAEEITISEDPKCYLHGDVNGDGEVGTQDAIYALYYAMWHDVDASLYPVVNQGFDFTGEGKVSAKDALYLLWASYDTEGYELEGEKHEHYEPYWTWIENEGTVTATLTVRCGCGEPIILDKEAGVEILTVSDEAATCLAAGKTEYSAKVTYMDKEYVAPENYIVTEAALGHNYDGKVQTCTDGVTCVNEGCDTDLTDGDVKTPYSLPALGHKWKLNEAEEKTYAATCTAAGQKWYDCANRTCGEECTDEGCQEHYTVPVEQLPHNHVFVSSSETKKENTTCTYVITSIYKCECGDEITSDSEYDNHNYVVTIKTPATCKTAGEKAYKCVDCEAVKTDVAAENKIIPVNPEAHDWDNGETVSGITTYTCKVDGCGQTKTAVAVEKNQAITNDQLQNELHLGNANVSLDQKTVEGLNADKAIKISVEAADKNNLSLTEEQAEQVEGITVYDFNMAYDDGTPVTEFEGEVTVSLPYTLQPGDDIDAIDIWYINDEGELAEEPLRGVYSNGFVTFKTNHFSYYTVTRLTPAERCKRYGHIPVEAEKTATCTEGGYKMSVCQRCAAELSSEIYPAKGHDLKDIQGVAKVATCTQDGVLAQKCQTEGCNYEIHGVIPAMGHDMQKNEDRSSDATCYAPGVLVTVCANTDAEGNPCGHEVKEELAQLEHSFKKNPVEKEHPTCTSSGTKHQKCDLCGENIKLEDIVPLGHDYVVVENGWHWNEDRTSATVDLVCKNDPGHTQTRKAVVTLDKEKSSPATCTVDGYLVYTATSTFNRLTFTDSVTMEQPATGHKTSGAWKNNADEHYRFCETCGQRADSAEHYWGSINVTKEPTCKDPGVATAACVICGYSTTETIPSTGEHDLVNGKCSVCGFTENNCTHMKMRSTMKEITGHGICDGLVLQHYSCECGEVGYVFIWEAGCDFESSWSNENGVYVDKMVCKDCGLTYIYQETMVYDDTNCTGYPLTHRTVSVGNTILLETEEPRYSWIQLHPDRVADEPIDLKQYGLCGGTITKHSCACGEAYWYETDFTCINGNHCDDCGAELVRTQVEKKNGCQVNFIITTSIKIDGKEVLAFDDIYTEPYHNFVVKDFEMEGTSCEDGVLIHYVCADCGIDRYEYNDAHVLAVRESYTDLTGYGSCATAVSKYTCFCGQEKAWFEGPNMDLQAFHAWTPVSATNDTYVDICSKCNYTRTTKVAETAKDENCVALVSDIRTFTDGKGHTYSMEMERRVERHNYNTTYELQGASCEDGVKRRETCNDCGYSYVSWEYNGHNAEAIKTYDLAEYGLCGEPKIIDYGCACGQVRWIERPGFECDWRGEGNENGHKQTCNNCGIEEVYTREVLATIDACHDRIRTTYAYSKNGQEIAKIQYTNIETTHRDVVTYSLNDPAQGCDGGYTLTWKCLDCGESHEEGTYYSHESRPVAREIASVNQLCGDLEIVTWSCACGRENWVNDEWKNGRCDFRWTNYDHSRDCTIYTCTDCGAEREETYVWTPIDGEPCKENVEISVTITKNGKKAGSYTYKTWGYDHEEVFTYSLLGKTCDDGYTYSTSCAKCGEVMMESSEVRYGCEPRPIKTLLSVEHEGICGSVELYEAECACGATKEIHNGWSCWMNHIGHDEVKDRSIYQCLDCGLKWYDQSRREHVDGTCTANQTYNWGFELNGEVLGSYQGTHVVTDHKYMFDYSLNGQTCDDGWTATKTCIYCSKTMTEQSSGHWHELIQYYDLSKYGLCGGSYEIYGCACGESNGWSFNDVCDWQHTGKPDPATGAEEFYCAECGTYKYEGETGQRDPATCTYKGVHFVKFVRGGQTVLEINRDFEHEAHDVRAVSTNILNPDLGCEGGVQVIEKCTDCDYSTENTYSHHRTYQVHSIDLSNGCGGKIEFYECVCGQEKHFSQELECKNLTQSSWSEYDADGVYHNFNERTCKTCGLVIENEWYSIHDEDSCDVEYHDNYTVTYNGQTYHHDRTQVWQEHDTRYTKASLLDGKTSCEDGVIVEWICRDCGATGKNHQNDHALVSVESIDLAPYGAICGGYLDKFSCACGERMRYDFATESECDPGHQGTAHWIPGVLNVTQDTTAGYIGTYSNAWIVKCAVSDPNPCGLTIRMAEYWLNENCMAVEYQTWQLGYDETTGTCQKEITIATGEKHAYHPYVQSSINETLADGSEVGGERWDCPNCGSYYYHKHTHLNGVQTRYEELYVNTRSAVNGEPKERSHDSVFGLVANGHSYATSNRHERIEADGTIWWEENVFSNYDFSNNDCRRTNTWSNSWGDSGVREEGAHLTNCKDYDSLEPTCSQHGEHVHAHVCVVCGNVADESRSELQPTGHRFEYDYAKQMYVCSVCELESAIGVMGAIYLEDLTKDGDSIYTIGYWNRDDIKFNPYVSVILDNVTDDDKEFVLSGITFDYLNVKEDGVRALTFDKAEAQAAADKLVADRKYSGSYAIRISFVPTSGDNTLDYAITFDSQNTAQ